MLVLSVYPDGKEVELSNKNENIMPGTPMQIKVLNPENERILFNGKVVEFEDVEKIYEYHGEECVIQCKSSKYIIKSNSIEPNKDVRSEYIEFNETLNKLEQPDGINMKDLVKALNSNGGVSLCTFDRVIQSVKADSSLKDIYECREYLRQVFMHPKVHLREEHEILPIEVVTRIGPKSIQHLASHSEHWESRRATGLVPSRIMARTLEDEFAIYENVVAKNLVDNLYKEMKQRQDVLNKVKITRISRGEGYTTLSNEENNVFQAQSILFKGYTVTEDVKNKEKDDSVSPEQMVEELIDVLIFCRESRLYEKLRKSPKVTGDIKATNIFMMDHNYRYIYKLWKMMQKSYEIDEEEKTTQSLINEYEKYCKLIMLFALDNFNFQNEEEKAVLLEKDSRSKMRYFFKKWNYDLTPIYINQIGVEAFESILYLKQSYAISVGGIDNLTLDEISVKIQRNNLYLDFYPTDEDIEKICYKVYPDNLRMINDKKNSKGDIKWKRNDLKRKISDYFKSVEKPNRIRSLYVPLTFKFVDSKRCIQACINQVKKDISAIVDEYEYCYFLVPFGPTDYENANENGDDYSKLFLEYPGIESDKMGVRYGIIPISISDINSYRRITKILLRQMVQIDEKYDICPICGSQLHERSGLYVCYNCAPEFTIRKTNCKCGKYYTNTYYKKPAFAIKEDHSYRFIMNEIKNGFKNVTDMVPNSDKCICPYCGGY